MWLHRSRTQEARPAQRHPKFKPGKKHTPPTRPPNPSFLVFPVPVDGSATVQPFVHDTTKPAAGVGSGRPLPHAQPPQATVTSYLTNGNTLLRTPAPSLHIILLSPLSVRAGLWVCKPNYADSSPTPSASPQSFAENPWALSHWKSLSHAIIFLLTFPAYRHFYVFVIKYVSLVWLLRFIVFLRMIFSLL